MANIKKLQLHLKKHYNFSHRMIHLDENWCASSLVDVLTYPLLLQKTRPPAANQIGFNLIQSNMDLNHYERFLL